MRLGSSVVFVTCQSGLQDQTPKNALMELHKTSRLSLNAISPWLPLDMSNCSATLEAPLWLLCPLWTRWPHLRHLLWFTGGWKPRSLFPIRSIFKAVDALRILHAQTDGDGNIHRWPTDPWEMLELPALRPWKGTFTKDRRRAQRKLYALHGCCVSWGWSLDGTKTIVIPSCYHHALLEKWCEKKIIWGL